MSPESKRLHNGIILPKELVTPRKPKTSTPPKPLVKKTFRFVKCNFCTAKVKENHMEAHVRKVHGPDHDQIMIEARIHKSASRRPKRVLIKRVPKLEEGELLYPINTSSPPRLESHFFYNLISNIKPIKISKTEVININKYKEGITKCPHGIIKPYTCGICNPEEYKRMHGID